MSARYAVGLDIGDGESSLAWIAMGESEEQPRLFSLNPGETSVVTAIALKRGGKGDEYVIGEAALREPDSHMVQLNFKTRPVLTPGRTPPPMPAVEFARLFWREFEKRHPDIANGCAIFVGCPAGWKEEASFYEKKLAEALEPHPVTVVPESQSAFIYVVDVARIDPQKAHPVLVVDVGSSTTDFTLVDKEPGSPEFGEPHNLPFGDQLGCKDIDKAMRKWVISSLEDQDPSAAQRLGNPWEGSLLLWLCRRRKEAAYGHPAAKEPSPSGILNWVLQTCSDRLATIDVEGLVNREWRPRLLNEVVAVHEYLGTRQPQLVLTTGGGSRMPFVGEICREVFGLPEESVNPVPDPSHAVARGLACYGRWRDRVDRFGKKAGDLADSDDIERIVRADADRFARRFYNIFYSNIFKAVLLPIADEIERGANYRDLMEHSALYSRIVKWIDSPDGSAAREELVGPLEQAIEKKLSPKTEELCKEFGLKTDALQIKIHLPPERWYDAYAARSIRKYQYVIRKYQYVRSPVGRATLRMFAPVNSVISSSLAPVLAVIQKLTEDDIEEIIRRVQDSVREQLLKRVGELERLLARPWQASTGK